MYLLAAVRALLRRPALPRVPAGWVTATEPVAVAAYLIVLAVAVGRMASARLFWFDELFTLYLARFGSPAELWHNLAAGADNNPPAGYLFTAAAVAVFGETHLAVRLPAVAGAVLAGLCLYLFVRRRRGAAEGLLALTAVGTTAPVWVYFLEARPYGPMIGLTALALLCWQRATDPETRRPGWLVGFAAAGVLGIASHYFFVVPLAGLAVAEAVRTVARRKIDRPVLAGFAAAGLMLAALYPLWGFGPKTYAAGFWAKVKLSRAAVEDAFGGMYQKELTVPVVLALAAGVVAGVNRGGRVAGWLGGFQQPNHPTTQPPTYPPWEAVALATIAAGPAIGVLIGAKLVGGYHYRYTVPAAVGLAGLFAFAVGRAAGPAKWGCLLAAAAFAFTGAAGQWTAGPKHYKAEAAALHATADFLDRHAPGGAVVVESPFEFARVWHYHPGRRFAPVFLADPAAAYHHTRVDTTDRGLVALGRVTAAPVIGFDELLRRLEEGKPTYYFGSRVGWLPAELPAFAPEPRCEACGAEHGRAGWRRGELEARGVRFEWVADRPTGTLYRLKL